MFHVLFPYHIILERYENRSYNFYELKNTQQIIFDFYTDTIELNIANNRAGYYIHQIIIC